MASTHKHIRSSTASKRPTTAIADGQLAINTNAASAGLFFKDSTGATIIKVGPVHVGTTAPNATPAAGGSSGNSTGEVWLDTSLTPPGVKIWNGGAWVNATPAGSTTVQGLLELATNAETQTGSDAVRAVTPASLQSKVSDSTSTTSSTTIASSTAVKSAYDLANAALPKTGGTVTGTVTFGTTGVLAFEGSTDDGFETAIGVSNPTADRTVTIPDQDGNFLISGNASIVNADVNASAAIAGTKISPNFGSQTVQTTGVFSHALGTAGAPTITFTGDTNTGIYSPGADQVAISTSGTGKLFIDSAGKVTVKGVGTAAFVVEGTAPDNSLVIKGSTGNVGLGTSTPGSLLNLRLDNATLYDATDDGGQRDSTATLLIQNENGTNDTFSQVVFDTSSTNQSVARIAAIRTGSGSNDLAFVVEGSNVKREAMRILSSGNVGVGTTSPNDVLHVMESSASAVAATGASVAQFERAGNVGITLSTADSGDATIFFGDTASSTIGRVQYGHSDNSLGFWANALERARIDSSGRLLVGTSNAYTTNAISNSITSHNQVAGAAIASASTLNTYWGNNVTGSAVNQLAKSRGGLGTHTTVQSGDRLGAYSFGGSDGTSFIESARIEAAVDGTPGLDDMPGRLVFSTTADGASSPTERMRIKQTGSISCYQTGSDALVLRTSQAAGTTNKLITGVYSGTGVDAGGTACFYVRTNGDVENTNNSYGPISSDERLKQDIVDAGSQWDDIKNIRITNFHYKNNPTGELQLGPIAQELEKVSPGLITRRPASEEEVADPSNGLVDGDEVLSFKASILYMKAVKALQEAMERIETLEAKVAALETP